MLLTKTEEPILKSNNHNIKKIDKCSQINDSSKKTIKINTKKRYLVKKNKNKTLQKVFSKILQKSAVGECFQIWKQSHQKADEQNTSQNKSPITFKLHKNSLARQILDITKMKENSLIIQEL